ncbi:hyaluronidase-1-like [Hyperolius riggenbachi]|uniref:hyaluronidase-1-like n=1 Tax=Hyperolius riggenbachi TaxID=752182 RepID=UPI0035A328C6
MYRKHSLTVQYLITVLLPIVESYTTLLPGRPFATVWNAPTSQCWGKYGVDLDLDPFDIVANQNQTFSGSEMVIFYKNQLGMYPYYDQDSPVYGGLPQNVSLKDHLTTAYEDLVTTIPSEDFKGVVVVDWEDWRPIWDRNWDAKEVYKRHSEEMVRERHPEWPDKKVIEAAKEEFEDAAANFMMSTLDLGRKFRPGGLWGFYGFPNCYNAGYKKEGLNYTGECPADQMAKNDLLKWMWRSSQALYPDIYLEQMLKSTEYVGRYVKHRVEEAFRVSGEALEDNLPVLPYARIVYTYSMDFLTQEDLIQTIGQSAALGTAGVILWGNVDYSHSKEACLAVKSYIDNILGMYVVNVTTSSALCSRALCTGNGRCVRKDFTSNSHLHLNPENFNIKKNQTGHGFLVSGKPSKTDILYMADKFQCRCYPGWKGLDCSQQVVF